MLVVVSDLHFVDGTAGEHNVPVDGFRIFFESIRRSAERLKDEGRPANEIKILFLGDIFDILRTEQWFQAPVSERPWGGNKRKIEERAGRILDDIITKNQAVFDLLCGGLKEEIGFHVEPERIYVPGNHDRLCNQYPSLREKASKHLGAPVKKDPLDYSFQDPAYGVFCRHGHEYDPFNYEGGASYEHHDYMRVPIGDPITTELVAKLPWKIMQHPAVKKLPAKTRNKLKRNFQEIENVRPFSATLEWLLYQVKSNLSIREAIEDSVDEVIQEFNKLPFVKKWYERHDKWLDFLDEADKIQAFLFLLEKFKVFSFERWMPLLERLKSKFSGEEFLEAAEKEYNHLDKKIRYIVYGHTHQPCQVPIRLVLKEARPPLQHVYLNSGTWRARYHKCRQGLGFIGWKNLTYLVFYTKEERQGEFPAFETWSGTLKTI